MGKLRKEVEIWGKKIGLRVSPLAPVCYHQEFNSSLTGDFIKLMKAGELGLKLQNLGKVLEENPEKLMEYTDDFAKIESAAFEILKFVYAMNRADNFGDKFPEYREWLTNFDEMNFIDWGWIGEVVPVIQDGFFRNSKPGRGTIPK